MAKSHNRTGRSKSHGRFVSVHEYVVRSYSWSRLKPVARCAWIEIGFMYNGSNNGTISIPARLLAERLGVGPTCAAAAIRELINWGFLDLMKASDFGKKKLAAEYRLTHFNCDVTGEVASKRFLRTIGDNVVKMRVAAE